MIDVQYLLTGNYWLVTSSQCPVEKSTAWWLVPGDWCLRSVLTVWCPVTGDQCLMTRAWCPVFCDQWRQLPGDWWPVPGAVDCLVTDKVDCIVTGGLMLTVSQIHGAATLMGLTPCSKAMRSGDSISPWKFLEGSELTVSFLEKIFDEVVFFFFFVFAMVVCLVLCSFLLSVKSNVALGKLYKPYT